MDKLIVFCPAEYREATKTEVFFVLQVIGKVVGSDITNAFVSPRSQVGDFFWVLDKNNDEVIELDGKITCEKISKILKIDVSPKETLISVFRRFAKKLDKEISQ